MDEYDYTVNKMQQWYNKKVKTLSIIAPPFNTLLIFEKLIVDIVKRHGKVLYIWGEDGENKEILDMIRKYATIDITHSAMEEGEGLNNINQVNYKNVEKIIGNYELTIFDDISVFSRISKQAIAVKYLWISHLSNKVILYTVDRAITIGDTIEMAHTYKNFPFVEPRVLSTRIDLKQDIPYMVYDYLKWFLDKNKNAIIYVPDEESLNIVYEYYSNKLKIQDTKVICISKNEKISRNILKIKDRSVIIITDWLEYEIESYKVENAIVLFADSKKYNYKKLIYICGKIGAVNRKLPEVLLVANEITEDMNKAKIIAQGFNKKVWDRKYKNYLK